MKKVKIKTIEKLKKEREKFRQKIIKEFGNPIVKLFSDEDLNTLRKLIKNIQSNYVEGAGSCWWSITKDYISRRDTLEEYLLTIPYVREMSIRDYSQEELDKKGKDYKYVQELKIKFYRPDHETEFRE